VAGSRFGGYFAMFWDLFVPCRSPPGKMPRNEGGRSTEAGEQGSGARERRWTTRRSGLRRSRRGAKKNGCYLLEGVWMRECGVVEEGSDRKEGPVPKKEGVFQFTQRRCGGALLEVALPGVLVEPLNGGAAAFTLHSACAAHQTPLVISLQSHQIIIDSSARGPSVSHSESQIPGSEPTSPRRQDASALELTCGRLRPSGSGRAANWLEGCQKQGARARSVRPPVCGTSRRRRPRCPRSGWRRRNGR
jgi:hypothetical protein